MEREYVTGWFSPADPELMVIFYETDGKSGVSFEAEILRQGAVIRTVRENSLSVLQSDIINRYGGAVMNPALLCEPGRPPRNLQARVRGLIGQGLSSWRNRQKRDSLPGREIRSDPVAHRGPDRLPKTGCPPGGKSGW